MEAKVETSDVLLSSWQVWYQIFWQATFGAPDTNHSGSLSGINWLVSQMLLWNNHQLEIQQKKNWIIHSRIHPSGAIQISSQATDTGTTCTTSLVTTKLGIWHIRNTLARTNPPITENQRDAFILRQSNLFGAPSHPENYSCVKISGTIKTDKSVYKLLDYCAIHPDDTLQYKSSVMILKSHSDVSYLSESQEIIIAGVFLYLGDTTNNYIRPNGAIVCNVMLAAVESECGTLFYNAK